MQLNPRYDDPTFLRLLTPTDPPGAATIRQRARLADLLAGLTPDQWASESRCAGWSVQDVIAHLTTTNQFWAFSLAADPPTRFLATFDPVASPAELVEGVRGQSPDETLARFVETNDALTAAIGAIDDWDRPAEAPPGHIPVRGVVLHALWDSWIHERDIALPLGMEPAREDDEVLGTLTYAASLGLLFDAVYGDGSPRTLAVEVTDPDASFVVELDGGVTVRPAEPADFEAEAAGTVVRGPAVDVAEALSLRGPFPEPVPAEVMRGLATVFDQ